MPDTSPQPAEPVRLPYHYSILAPSIQFEMGADESGQIHPSIHMRSGSTVELTELEFERFKTKHPELVEHIRCLVEPRPVQAEAQSEPATEASDTLRPPPGEESETTEEPEGGKGGKARNRRP